MMGVLFEKCDSRYTRRMHTSSCKTHEISVNNLKLHRTGNTGGFDSRWRSCLYRAITWWSLADIQKGVPHLLLVRGEHPQQKYNASCVDSAPSSVNVYVKKHMYAVSVSCNPYASLTLLLMWGRYLVVNWFYSYFLVCNKRNYIE